MTRRYAVVALATLALAGCGERAAAPAGDASVAGAEPAAAATPAGSAQAETVRFTGAVVAANAASALEQVGDQLDRTIGLKLTIQPSTEPDFDASRYLVSADAGQLVVNGGTTEVVIPDGAYRMEGGVYRVDGFFTVKSGGMHQGTISYGLEPIAAAAPRNVVDRPIG